MGNLEPENPEKIGLKEAISIGIDGMVGGGIFAVLGLAATLALVNTIELQSIAAAGSIGFLLIFAIVNFTGFKLAIDIKAGKIIPLSGFILCMLAVGALIVHTYTANKTGLAIATGIVFTCFVFEYLYKKSERFKAISS